MRGHYGPLTLRCVPYFYVFPDSLSLTSIPDEISTSSCYSWFMSLTLLMLIQRFLRAVTRARTPTCLHLAACCVCCLPFNCELAVAKPSGYKLVIIIPRTGCKEDKQDNDILVFITVTEALHYKQPVLKVCCTQSLFKWHNFNIFIHEIYHFLTIQTTRDWTGQLVGRVFPAVNEPVNGFCMLMSDETQRLTSVTCVEVLMGLTVSLAYLGLCSSVKLVTFQPKLASGFVRFSLKRMTVSLFSKWLGTFHMMLHIAALK